MLISGQLCCKTILVHTLSVASSTSPDAWSDGGPIVAVAYTTSTACCRQRTSQALLHAQCDSLRIVLWPHVHCLLTQVSSFEHAMHLMGDTLPSHGAPAAAVQPYQPATFVSRLSVKLFNCTPRDLPADLRDQLTGWLHSTPAGAEGGQQVQTCIQSMPSSLNSASPVVLSSGVESTHLQCAGPYGGLCTKQSVLATA